MQLVFVGNPKGGTGKSFFTTALVNYLVNKGDPVTLVDSDTSNPDTSRRFTKDDEVKIKLLNLREHDPWIDLVSLVHDRSKENPHNGVIVINLPAGIGHALEQELDDFAINLKPLNVPMTMFFVADRTEDSINLLRLSMSQLFENSVKLVFVRNLHWGAREKFSMWDQSVAVNPEFVKRGGIEIELADLEDKIAYTVLTAKPARRFSVAAADLEYGKRMYLEAHVRKVAAVLDPIFLAPASPKTKSTAAS